MAALAKWFPWIAPLPPILFGVTWLLSRGFEGWSGWAAASVFAIPLFASAFGGVLGLVLVIRAHRIGHKLLGTVLSTLVAASVVLGLLGRLLLL